MRRLRRRHKRNSWLCQTRSSRWLYECRTTQVARCRAHLLGFGGSRDSEFDPLDGLKKLNSFEVSAAFTYSIVVAKLGHPFLVPLDRGNLSTIFRPRGVCRECSKPRKSSARRSC